MTLTFEPLRCGAVGRFATAWLLGCLAATTAFAEPGSVRTADAVVERAGAAERSPASMRDATNVDAPFEVGAFRGVVLAVEGRAQALLVIDSAAGARDRLLAIANAGPGRHAETHAGEHASTATAGAAGDTDLENESRPAQPTWVELEAGMSLPPGSTVRTGVRSSIVLRLGLNATVRVNALSRVTIETLTAEGGSDGADAARPDADAFAGPNDASRAPVLRTRLGLDAGDVDVRVDHVGPYSNDFKIRTPEATLAVRGTNFSAGVDAISGLRVQGASTNSLRAIELSYVNDELEVALAESGVDGLVRDPALLALAATIARPNEGVDTRTFRERIGRPLAGLVTFGGVQRGEPTDIRAGDIQNANSGSFVDRLGSEQD